MNVIHEMPLLVAEFASSIMAKKYAHHGKTGRQQNWTTKYLKPLNVKIYFKKNAIKVDHSNLLDSGLDCHHGQTSSPIHNTLQHKPLSGLCLQPRHNIDYM